MAIDLAWGEPPNAWHPVGRLGNGSAHFKWLARRIGRSDQPRSQALAGAAIVLLGIAAAFPAWFLHRAMKRLPAPLRWLVAALALKPLFAVRAPFDTVYQVEAALRVGDLAAARRVARRLVGSNAADLDGPLLAAAAIASLAENLSDSVVAPVLAYLVGGLPLAACYRTATALGAALGNRGHREYLGKAAAMLDDVFSWVPARLTAVLLAIAAPLVGQSPPMVLRVAKRERRRMPSANAGWPVAAAAVALGRCLEKRGHHRPYPAGPEPRASDVARARRLATGALLVGAAAILAAQARLA